ncbi:hypothetical protein ACIOEW_36415 [Streptomyces sp. NPDC087901]|uniref:hypothetical protein n=1 Tax=Streptomyces sp. NPDC087901 TaxID=3365818 RepID=UPI00380351E1
MITLHGVYEEGSEAVKEAIRAFGARHAFNGAAPGATPDWDWAQQHFTYLIEAILGRAVPRSRSAQDTVRRAENEAVHFLLSISNLPDYRCPICVRRQASSVSPRPTLEAS